MTVVLGLVNPYLTKLIIDKAYGNKDLKLFIILAAVGGIIFVLNGVLNGLSNYLNRYIRLRINFDLNRKVFKRLQQFPYGFFQDSSTGENLYKINYDIEQVSQFIADVLPQAISLIPKSLFILMIVFYMNWHMALFALALMPFLYLSPYYFAKRFKKALKMWVENSQDIFQRLQEVLSHMQLVKAFGKERSQIREYIRGLIKNIRFSLTNTKLEVAGSFANSLTNRIILGLILFFGGYQVIKGKMTLGSLSAITIYLSQLSGLQSSLANFFQQITFGLVSCERLEMILEAPLESREDEQAKEILFSKGQIQFKDITFGYKKDKMVLENLSFNIAGGSCIGLVGHSGCGKTTITNLILRLYKPIFGEIIIDGYNMNIMKSKSIYEQIGVVLQEPYLWNVTIEDNIRYGKQDAIFEEISRVAQIACIDDFINTLPQEYDTIIGENACKISEGQKERIAIARTLIKRPKILILDEAMSSLDSETEDRIINNIKAEFKNSTVIVVSHRLSTIKKMDLVYFLESPSNIEIGFPDELLERSQKYRELFASQIEKAPEGQITLKAK